MISPSLDGVLNHATLSYEGLNRPIELLRVLDGPATKGAKANKLETTKQILSAEDRKTLQEYFQDLYGVFMKKFSFFIVDQETSTDEGLKLQAMLQEMIKVKRLVNGV